MANNRNDIEKYVKGELTPAERNALERKALDDPFLMDALEGAEQISATEFADDLTQLHHTLQDRVEQKARIIPFWLWSARIAAGLALIAISTFMLLKFMQRDSNSDLALQKTTPSAPEEQSAVISDSINAEKDKAIASAEPALEKPKATLPEAKSRKETETRQSGPEQEPVVTPQPTEAIAEVRDADVEEQSAPAQEGVRTNESETKVNSSYGYTQVPAKDEAKMAETDDLAKKLDSRAAGIQVDRSDAFKSKEVQRLVSGRVTDEQGDGIPGVNVLIKGTDIGTVTDAMGNYQIHIDDNKSNLVFSFIGMETLEETVPVEPVLDVSLDPDVSQLSEVVVVGYGVQRTEEEEEVPTLELAVPAGGRVAYKQYLEKNLKYPEQAIENKVEGRVTVQFTVDTSGKIGDFNVLKGLGFGCDEEVIRLIKQGPKWNPTKRDTEPVADKVKVRMRFRLPKNK